MKIILFFLLCLISVNSFSQESYYTNPVKIPLLLSGSFAELRSNHFHSGIDIKTQGTTGLPVYAAAEGYISRISVSPTGFGKALYINHPNGTTTVYGHLLAFAPEIERFVKNKQYEDESFRVDIQVPEFLFPVKKDEEIAKSGNTGSSGGPHLHFEIRDTQSEEPLNPLKYNFPVKDNIAPKIFSVLLTPLSYESHVDSNTVAKSFAVVFYDGKYHLKNNPTIPVWGPLGVAIQTNDYFNDSYNKCGINLLRMMVDGETLFTFQLNRFAFQNSRYINSHIVYSEFIDSKRRFVKTWLDPGNKLPIYNHNGSQGIILLQKDEVKQVEIEIQDTYGNTSLLEFKIKGTPLNLNLSKNENTIPFKYDQENNFENNSVKLSVPKGALYDDFDFVYTSEPPFDGCFSDYHIIHKKNIPLHIGSDLKLKVNSLPEHLKSKALIANVDAVTGEYYSAGGKYNNGWMETKINNFGVYTVIADTIAPSINSLSIKENALTEPGRIRFKIEDELSGIKSYEGILDDKWALFEYDPKSKTLTHYFDKERFEFNKNHHLKLTVIDNRENESVYETSFWK